MKVWDDDGEFTVVKSCGCFAHTLCGGSHRGARPLLCGQGAQLSGVQSMAKVGHVFVAPLHGVAAIALSRLR